MWGESSVLGGAIGVVLASVVVASGLVLVGFDPVLGGLAGTVVGLDVQYYRHRAGGDPAELLREFADGSR